MLLDSIKPKSVYIYSNGCTSNMIDSERMSQFFKLNGYTMTVIPSKADLLVVNTCAFEKETEDDSIKKIISLQRSKRKCAKIIVTGCLPAINEKRLKRVFNGDVFGIRNERTWSRLNSLIDAKIPISKVKDPNELSQRWPDSTLLAKYKACRENNIGESSGHYNEKDSRGKYLNISIQSASKKILNLIRREIDRERLISELMKLRHEAGSLIVLTHCMEGFAGETWLYFLSLLTFSFKIKNFKYLTFVFDPKQGTYEATMKKQVSSIVKRSRFYILKMWRKMGVKLCYDGETY